MRSVVAEKIQKHCFHAAGLQEETRHGNRRRRRFAAEYFRPVHKLIGVKLVQKIGTRVQSAVAEKIKIYCDRCSLCYAAVCTVFLSFLDNHRPLSSPVSIFRTDLTPLNLNLCKGRKYSAAQIGDGDFRGGSLLPMLSGSRMSIVFRGFLGNR